MLVFSCLRFYSMLGLTCFTLLSCTFSPESVIVTPSPVTQVTSPYSGYEKVERLPNNILIPAIQPESASIIQTLILSPEGGGYMGPCPFVVNTAPPTIVGPLPNDITLCNYRPSDHVVITLTLPDGSQLTTKGLVKDIAHETLSYDDGYFEHSYCIDAIQRLLPGDYSWLITSVHGTWTGTFQVENPSKPEIFLGESCPRWLYPDSGPVSTIPVPYLIIEGEPVHVFYTGFQPHEAVKITVYRLDEKPLIPDGSSIFDFEEITFESSVEKVNSWTAQMDDNGRLVEYIEAPKLPRSGTYAFIVEDNRHEEYDLNGITVQGTTGLIWGGVTSP